VKAKREQQVDRKAASGILETLPKGFGFLRSRENQYRPSEADVYVPSNLIRRLQIKPGTFVEGVTSPGRGKGLQLREVQQLDGRTPAEYKDNIPFPRLTSIDPFEKFEIDKGGDPILRVIDLLAPIGKGQRGLVVAAPRTGKTIILQKLACSISETNPEVELIALLIGERPEEVTDFRRSTPAEVVASSADQKASHHIQITEMVLERARRLVESGRDVVILLDSITRMARAYNVEESGRGRTLSGGLGVGTLAQPREFFGAARKAEEGGSVTIIATALVDTGSRMDDVIFEEFKGTGNMELILDRRLAERRIWPAIDLHASGTRKEEKLRDDTTQNKINLLRRALSGLSKEEAMQTLLQKIQKTPSNEHFLNQILG
jgi:transcription termination factor Rho